MEINIGIIDNIGFQIIHDALILRDFKVIGIHKSYFEKSNKKFGTGSIIKNINHNINKDYITCECLSENNTKKLKYSMKYFYKVLKIIVI